MTDRFNVIDYDMPSSNNRNSGGRRFESYYLIIKVVPIIGAFFFLAK